MSSHFDTIHSKLSTHAYFALLFHSMLSENENSKNKFYDVLTSVLYTQRLVARTWTKESPTNAWQKNWPLTFMAEDWKNMGYEGLPLCQILKPRLLDCRRVLFRAKWGEAMVILTCAVACLESNTRSKFHAGGEVV